MEVKNNCRFSIAVGRSRLDKVWHNEETTWSQFLDRISNSISTGETAEQYAHLPKSKKGSLKDIGGYVGAVLTDGIRQKAHVKAKTLITLDMDNAPDDYMYVINKVLHGCGFCIHSTHSHTNDHPRMRIVMPITREVTPDEYIAMARKLADKIGMEFFDLTTFAPERLMFWPSHPRDVEPVFYLNDAPILNPDTVLAEYDDWRDSTQWPMGKTEPEVPRQYQRSMGGIDPTDKPGWVGAFCRCYDIPHAIETYLSGIYDRFKNRVDRYTFVQGSSAGGLHVFNNGKLAYSFHATDPASQICCNAFDLVRIHLFGGLDTDPKDRQGSQAPSYKAMVENVCLRDSAVKYEMARMQRTKPPEPVKDSDFDDSLITEEVTAAGKEEGKESAKDDAWIGQLAMTKSGKLLKNVRNLQIIFSNDRNLKGCIAYDLFASRLVKTRPMVWDREKPDSDAWSDTDDACLRNYLDTKYDLQVRAILDDVLRQEAHDHEFHPVRDWFRQLPPWDGVKRVERLFIDYLGADDSEYTKALARLLCRAVVARIFHPGCKWDYVIVLSGGQGIGKSTLLRKLGGKWFSDSLTTFEGKDAIEQLQGRTIIEVGEMQAASKSDAAAMKAFISRQVDKVRLPYEHRSSEFPRQCVLVATSNDKAFLKDTTGNRRFLPVDVAQSKLIPLNKSVFDMKDEDIRQIWAEAYADFKANYKSEQDLCLPENVEKTALEMQEAHMEGLEMKDQIEAFLELPVPENWKNYDITARREWVSSHLGDDLQPGMTYVERISDIPHSVRLIERNRVCTLEILCELFGKDKDRIMGFERKNVMSIMGQIPGWKWSRNVRAKLRIYGIQRCFVRCNNANKSSEDDALFS